jgi:hypothetical protein
MRKFVWAACAALIAGPVLAAGSFYGRWASDLTACANQAITGPLVVNPLSLQWPDTVCAVRTSYRVGDAWHIGARCRDAATDVPVKLLLKADRLVIDWSGAQAELRRCP